MTPEQLTVYNKNRIKRGLKPILDNGKVADDAISDFSKYGEVTPYTTGLLTSVFNTSSLAKGEFNTQDFEKNIKQELDNISTSTQYLFDAVDAAQEAYSNSQTAIANAADAASQAQDAANAASDAAATAQGAADDASQALIDYENQQEQILLYKYYNMPSM